MEKPLYTQDSPSFVDLCTLHQYAMRYYRLWIYTCNTVLALATLVFTVFAVSVLVDPRISLLSGVELYQPTFLYAYLALLLQCGVLQTIGCLGALRLNQRLLNTYWTLLLVLMIGDIVVGLFWAFRLDRIKTALRPNLRHRLKEDYGRDPEFTQVWDWLQSHEMCCGVDGPNDYHLYNETVFAAQITGSSTDSTILPTLPPIMNLLPSTCCTLYTIANYSQHSSLHSSQKKTSPPSQQVSSTYPSPGSMGTMNAHLRRRIPIRKTHESKTDSGINHASISSISGSTSSMSSSIGGSTGSLGIFQSSPPIVSQSPGTLPLSPQHPLKHSQILHHHHHHHYRGGDAHVVAQSSVGFHSVCQLPPDLIASLHSDNVGGGSNPVNQASDPVKTKLQPSSKKDANDVIKIGGGSPRTSEESSASSSSSSTNKESVLPMSLTSSSFSSFTSGSSSNNNNASFPPYPSSSSMGHSSVNPSPTTRTSGDTDVPASGFGAAQQEQKPPGPATTTTKIPLHILLEQRKYMSQEHSIGCADKILHWLDHVTDVLFVIGFCIIVFLKGCFLAILRYEIKEMIQKIRLLNGEDPSLRSPTMNELIGLTSMYDANNSQGSHEEDGDNPPPDAGSNAPPGSKGCRDSQRQSYGGNSNGGEQESALLTVPDSSLPNNTSAHVKHQQMNHVSSSNKKEQQHHQDNIVIEDDYDSSSALLSNASHRPPPPQPPSVPQKAPPPFLPRTFLKNGNNNFAAPPITRAASAPVPHDSQMASSVP